MTFPGRVEIPKVDSNLSFRKFFVFSAMGAAGTGFQYATLILLVERFSTDAVAASITGSIIGALVNFLLNHHVTFRSNHRMSRTAPRFFSVAAAALLLNAVLMYLLQTTLGMQYLIAQFLVTACVLVFNFCSNAIWTFASRG